jgi:hypothetical protein
MVDKDGLGVKLGGLINGEGIFVVRRTVATGRVRSRLVICHGFRIARRVSTSRRLSPWRRNYVTIFGGKQAGLRCS